MNTTRFETLFCLRYAERVLERYARVWRRADAALRVFALLSASAAIWALGAQDQRLAIILGLLFALVQALQHGVGPARIEQQALAAKFGYADLLARERVLSDEQLEDAYRQVAARDNVIVPEYLRRLAYNDVAEERGCDTSDLYALGRFDRARAILG